MSFSTLIVGLGQIGVGYDIDLDPTHVYSHARAFSQHKTFTLIGGVDKDEQHCKRFEQHYECPSFSTINEALKKCQPDVIILAVPTQLHGECLLQVLEQANPKLILCEKPLSYDIEEAKLMVQACDQRNILLYTNYMRHSDKGVQEIKRRLDAGIIKKPLKGVVWYSKGLIHNGSHFLNLLEYWLGSYQRSNLLDKGRLFGEKDSEPEFHVTFEQGSVFFTVAKEEAFSHYTVELVAPNGRLRYEQGGEKILWEEVCEDPYFQGYRILSPQAEAIDSGMKRYQLHVVEQLANALEGKQAFLCSGFEALQTLMTIQHILR